MNPIAEASPVTSTQPGVDRSAFADLDSEDFFKLLITQLTNQDPMEPTGNEELMKQIASIRDIELSTTLTESLQSLTGQQRFASASSLIGQYVTAGVDGDGAEQRGVVVGVRFEADGRPVLQLSNGKELPADAIVTVQPPLRVGESMVGQVVVGVDTADPSSPRVVEGVVTAARLDENQSVSLELDTGDVLRLRDVVSMAALET